MNASRGWHKILETNYNARVLNPCSANDCERDKNFIEIETDVKNAHVKISINVIELQWVRSSLS